MNAINTGVPLKTPERLFSIIENTITKVFKIRAVHNLRKR